jgi:hypothetical protein
MSLKYHIRNTDADTFTTFNEHGKRLIDNDIDKYLFYAEKNFQKYNGRVYLGKYIPIPQDPPKEGKPPNPPLVYKHGLYILIDDKSVKVPSNWKIIND